MMYRISLITLFLFWLFSFWPGHTIWSHDEAHPQQGEAHQTPAETPSHSHSREEEATLKKGAELYQAYCSVCHGDKGNGQSWARHALNPPPRDFTSPLSRQRLFSGATMFNAIKYGRPGTAMVAWGSRLSDEEIGIIVKYIRTTFMKIGEEEHPHTHHHPVSTEAGRKDRGDPRAGKALYEQNCAACHGIKGDGRGPRSHFIVPPPRNFNNPIEMMGIRDRNHLFTRIQTGVVGTVMPAWGGVLSDQQIWDIVAYIEEAFLKKEP